MRVQRGLEIAHLQWVVPGVREREGGREGGKEGGRGSEGGRAEESQEVDIYTQYTNTQIF